MRDVQHTPLANKQIWISPTKDLKKLLKQEVLTLTPCERAELLPMLRTIKQLKH